MSEEHYDPVPDYPRGRDAGRWVSAERIAEHTIEVRRDAIPYDDWREDPRFDQLYEYALELFGDGLEGSHGRLRNPAEAG